MSVLHSIIVKSKVIINAWAIGRDPRYWSKAPRFYPERFIDSSFDYKGSSFEYIPFGAGRRICPGSTFGLINVGVALALLLYHFDWKLPSGMKSEDWDMNEEFGLTVTRKGDLCLIPVISRPFLMQSLIDADTALTKSYADKSISHAYPSSA
ncbi:hypothetical protein VNO78_09812 [Psophocarpus tetragonolobus]|uniref:Cytochrome P450 n=1 Tax=Psophocarpus tetragonolobus TaxID=3891 RepID=A0AAN9T8P7_PSOTE